MTDRRGAGGPLPTTALGAVVVLVWVSALLAGPGAGTATAQPFSLTLKYACTFLGIGVEDITAKVSLDLPMSHRVGEPSHRFAIHAQATVGPTLRGGLDLAGAEYVEGTLEASTRVAAPEGNLAIAVPLTIARTAVLSSGSLVIPATGVAPSRTFSEPGPADIVLGDFSVRLKLKNGDGGPALVSSLDVSCTPRAGQNTVIARFGIDAARPPSAPSTSPAPPAGSAGSSGGRGGSAPRAPSGTASGGTSPGPTTAAPGPSTTGNATAAPGPSTTGTATPSATPATVSPGGAATDDTGAGPAASGGRKAREVVFPVVGVLVVAAVAALFGLRLRKRRAEDE
ncbi:hypothetical protein OG599_08670 [Streptomyces sp. NBC_01335]|uniref:DUF6801 domain-containing protein n=1 Tax=Streptomyces sp. NBC_01335 TaxID=2903828 RepID=UPI002E11F746|nr:hypothetical protein OG599_08670 [Streptomyces sp. NBC_01335]